MVTIVISICVILFRLNAMYKRNNRLNMKNTTIPVLLFKAVVIRIKGMYIKYLAFLK